MSRKSQAKSRPFSMYLLKSGYNTKNALKKDHIMDGAVSAENLPAKATLYVLDNDPKSPWWRGYFGIKKHLNQVTKGALIFLPIKNRCFALSFGHVAHYLEDSSYEYDFGLRVTLNSVDPQKLKSTDILEPGAALRKRTQVPVDSDLTYFDFDRDSTILKSLTGKVKDEYKPLFKHATGASNLHISSPVFPNELTALCEKLLELYASDAYKTTFPDIQNIAPVRDPEIIESLNAKLVRAFQEKDDALNLTVPDLINYRDNVYAIFSGAGSSRIYEDVYIGKYHEYLEENNYEIRSLGIENFKRHKLCLSDEEGSPRGENYSIYKSLIFDTSLNKGAEAYHLREGQWYKIETDYVSELESFLDPLWEDIKLPPYNHEREGVYNEDVADKDDAFICLDEENISPLKQTQIEPCDLYTAKDAIAVFCHVKRSTFSSQLSHQFNQGTNAIELLKLEQQAMAKLKVLITEKKGGAAVPFIKPLDEQNFHVRFCIVTRKDKNGKSRNLPLFSRISLRRSMKALRVMSVRGSFGFINDESPKTTGKEKKRKSRKKKNSKP
ncbi:MAG: TIGR04141 family sporadically distributed protein [Alphaproteobacteria bacterium]|nr:TIGR04141 family sporadically distributed protein [Alphaproteobacteria bacterium]